MPYKKILANNLIDFRKSEHISQYEIAARSDISRETVSLIERECANVTLDVLEKLISYMGITMPEIFTEDFVKISTFSNEKM